MFWFLLRMFLVHLLATHLLSTQICLAVCQSDTEICLRPFVLRQSEVIPRRRKNVDEVEVEDETETKAKGTISIFGNLKCPRSQLGAFSHSHLG